MILFKRRLSVCRCVVSHKRKPPKKEHFPEVTYSIYYKNFVNVCIGCLTTSPSSRTEQTLALSFVWDVTSFHRTVRSDVSKECSAMVLKVLLTSNLFCTVTPGFLLCGLNPPPPSSFPSLLNNILLLVTFILERRYFIRYSDRLNSVQTSDRGLVPSCGKQYSVFKFMVPYIADLY